MKHLRFPFICRLLSPSWLILTLALAGCGGSSGSASAPPVGSIPTTTTVQAETANNTSTAATFTAQGNGNIGPVNVSKMPVQQLLYAGSTTKVFAELQPWFGGTNHMNVGYHSDDPAQVHSQVEDMISRGINGAIIDWFGPNANISSAATILVQKEAEAHPGFQFAIMEDSGALSNAALGNNCDVTAQLISDLQFISTQFASSPAYMQVNGKAPVFMFGVTQFFVDWSKVLPTVPANMILLFRGKEGLQQSFAGGAFQWVDMSSTDPFDMQLSALNNFYTQAQAAGRPAVGAAFKGFDDSQARFGLNRQIHHQCGQTWLDTFQQTVNFFSPNHQLETLQIATWNDYEEGTEIETGIDGCTFLVPALSGTTLNWTVQGGPENTIDHFTVFASVDEQNLAKLSDVPAGQHTIDLTQFSLPSPVSLFVKAIGKSSIRNTLSAPVVMKSGVASPHAVLNLSLTSDLTVSANTSGSADPAGPIAQTTIDFGDGTVVNSTSAKHTYQAPGKFIVTATVVDNGGASAVAATRVEVKSVASGATILNPTNSASVNFPTPIVTSANSSNPISRTDVLIDGNPAHSDTGGVINSAFKVFAGPHTISLKATDSTGAVSQSFINVVGEPGNLPPTAAITVTPLPSVSPTTVLACAVTSHDPDGFILKRQIQFSDGATFTAPAAVHTLSAPGAFSVTLNVFDQFLATASTTQSFVVSSAATAASAEAQRAEIKNQQVQPAPEVIRRP